MVEKAPMRVQHKRMTKTQWASSAVILLPGEIGVESDTGYIKVGDGTNRFSALKYLTGPKGDKGDAFKYSDFTPDQLASLKGQKGDPLRFEDLTQEQINQLKGQKGDPLRFEDLTPEQINQLKAADIDLSGHTHEISDVNGLQNALNGKANSSHTHTIANITNLQATLNGKQPTGDYVTREELNNIQLTPGPPGASVTVQVVSSPPNSQQPNVLYLVRA